MNYYIIMTLWVWLAINILYSILTASWDSWSKTHNEEITLTRKNIRSGIIFIFNIFGGFVVYFHYGWSFIDSLMASIFFHNIFWIIFELVLNLKSNESPDYISDDGINDNTSLDDRFFHWIGKVLYGRRGPQYSGFIKILFKTLLALACFIVFLLF